MHLDEVAGVGVGAIVRNVEVPGVGVGASTGVLVSRLPDLTLTIRLPYKVTVPPMIDA